MNQKSCRLLYFSAICILASCIISGCVNGPAPTNTSHTIVVTDSKGDLHSFSAPVTRIVTQNGDAVELLIGIGAGDAIVGVADYTKNDPEVSAMIPQAVSIGDWQVPNIEAILSLSPDVMITYGSRSQNIDQILAANITVMSMDCYRVTELAREARILGMITGKQDRAEEYARFIEGYQELVFSRIYSDADRPLSRVYIEHYGDYSAEGKEGGGSQLLRMLNASQIGADLPGLTQKVSAEWIIDQKPEIIIKIVNNPTPDKNLSMVREAIMKRPGFDTIPAVRSGRVYVINGDLLNSPRGVAGLVYLAKAIYPDQFSDINPDLILEEYARRFYPGADEIERISPDLG